MGSLCWQSAATMARLVIRLCVVALIAVGCSTSSHSRNLDIATTTSVVNSGLLGALLPLFNAETGITVRVHAAGSGRALEMLHDQVVELVISHAPNLEATMLKAHQLALREDRQQPLSCGWPSG